MLSKQQEEIKLLSYRTVTKQIDRSCFNLHHSLKLPFTVVTRLIKLSNESALLLVPFKKTNGKASFNGCLGFKLNKEEQARIADILEYY